jgi:hypothetical protein
MNIKCTKWPKIPPMSVKYSKWPKNISTFSNLGVSKIYPKWDFWFEKKPSGNPSASPHRATKVDCSSAICQLVQTVASFTLRDCLRLKNGSIRQVLACKKIGTFLARHRFEGDGSRPSSSPKFVSISYIYVHPDSILRIVMKRSIYDYVNVTQTQVVHVCRPEL